MSDTSTTVQRHRSPSYPSFGLSTAIEKAKMIYEKQRRNTAAIDSVKKAMGYEIKTSHALRAIAALIQFGLLEEATEGTGRNLKLTDIGLGIAMRRENDPERMELIREAAIKPTIYKELFMRWDGDLPSNETLEDYLLFEKKFNPDVVAGVIKDFRATYEFAKLSTGGTISESIDDKFDTKDGYMSVASNGRSAGNAAPPTEGRSPGAKTMTPEMQPGIKMYQMPLPGNKEAVLQLPYDVTSEDIEFLTRYLTFMSEAFVPKPTPTPQVNTGQAHEVAMA